MIREMNGYTAFHKNTTTYYTYRLLEVIERRRLAAYCL